MRKINFSAGPSTLPESVLKRAQDELYDYQGKGFSIMEISHRTNVNVNNRIVCYDIKELGKQMKKLGGQRTAE